jgi:uncharacterized glyoxalase superfamily protein PhnB
LCENCWRTCIAEVGRGETDLIGIVDSDAEAERLYALLREGGEIFMAMEENFFAHRFAMLRDRFDASWMLIHDARVVDADPRRAMA